MRNDLIILVQIEEDSYFAGGGFYSLVFFKDDTLHILELARHYLIFTYLPDYHIVANIVLITKELHSYHDDPVQIFAIPLPIFWPFVVSVAGGVSADKAIKTSNNIIISLPVLLTTRWEHQYYVYNPGLPSGHRSSRLNGE